MSQNCSKNKRESELAMSRFTTAIIGISLFILITTFLGGYLHGGINGFKITVANIPSSYNSTRFVDNDDLGMMATVGKLNSATSDDVKIVSNTFYGGMVVIIKEIHNFVLKMHKMTLQEEVEDEKQKEQGHEEKVDQTASLSNSKGIVITPSKDKQTDADTIEQIKNTFSDEVRIIPDESGESGIIQPIFRDSEGDEYIYVLVPIQKDEK